MKSQKKSQSLNQKVIDDKMKKKSIEEREVAVQKAMDQTLIREIEYLLAFLVFIFVAYLIYVIDLVSKPPA